MEGTSKIKTPMENFLYATLLELDKVKVDVIKWKRMVEDNKGKLKEEVSQYFEKQLQIFQ